MTEDAAARRYRIGFINRRIAQRVANLDHVFRDVTGESGQCTLICACGREGCSEVVVVSLSDYEGIRASSPHRFVVAPGHATEIDEILDAADGYEVVEIKPDYRADNPLATAAPASPGPAA